jgi:FkbM family methyltransferase
LIDHHRLPSARLKLLSDLLVPGPGESSIEVVERSDGMRFELDLHSVAQRAVAYELSDEAELRLIADLIGPGEIALDVGANIGLYTVIMGRAVGAAGRVYSFEPNPPTAARLRRNVELNALGNVEVFELAVADAVGAANLRLPDAREPGLATIVGDSGPAVPVETITIDSFLEQRHIGRVALLKLDVEGAELDALTGATGAVRDGTISTVLFEVLNGSTEVQARLADHGFRLRAIVPGREIQDCRPDERFAYANILATR